MQIHLRHFTYLCLLCEYYTRCLSISLTCSNNLNIRFNLISTARLGLRKEFSLTDDKAIYKEDASVVNVNTEGHDILCGKYYK